MADLKSESTVAGPLIGEMPGLLSAGMRAHRAADDVTLPLLGVPCRGRHSGEENSPLLAESEMNNKTHDNKPEHLGAKHCISSPSKPQ